MELLDLGEDGISCILDYLDWKTLKNLSQTCSQLLQLTRSKIVNSSKLRFDTNSNRQIHSGKFQFDANKKRLYEIKEIKMSDLEQLRLRKYRACQIYVDGTEMRSSRRTWNHFLKEQISNMNSIEFGGTLKFQELFKTVRSFTNVTDLKLTRVTLTDSHIPNSITPADLSKLKSLELTYWENLPYNLFRNCRKLTSLTIGGILNTSTPVFNIVEFLQQQTELESLTIFNYPGKEMFFLETDISNSIKFQLKRFILYQTSLRSKDNLLKFLESQKGKLETLALNFCRDLLRVDSSCIKGGEECVRELTTKKKNRLNCFWFGDSTDNGGMENPNILFRDLHRIFPIADGFFFTGRCRTRGLYDISAIINIWSTFLLFDCSCSNDTSLGFLSKQTHLQQICIDAVDLNIDELENFILNSPNVQNVCISCWNLLDDNFFEKFIKAAGKSGKLTILEIGDYWNRRISISQLKMLVQELTSLKFFAIDNRHLKDYTQEEKEILGNIKILQGYSYS